MASKAVIDTLIAEAGGEGRDGLIAAAWALQQRAAARGLTLDQTVKQSGAFEGYSNPGSGSRKAQQNSRLRAQVEAILDGVSKGTIPNPVPGADHFLSGNANPSWAKNMDLVGQVGGHRFYASGNVPKSAMGNSALSAIDAVAPTPQTADLSAIRSAYAPLPQTAEGLNIRPVSTVSIDPRTGLPISSVATAPLRAIAPVPREPIGMVRPGNIDLGNRPIVRNPDGSISTVRSMSFGLDNGLEVLVPTVSPDGRILTDDQAIDRYYSTGENLGTFRTPEAATRFANQLHDAQANEYLPRANAPLPASSTNATIARTMASLPNDMARPSAVPFPSSMTAPRNNATPILQGNGQLIDPAALTLWEGGQPDIGLASLTSRPKTVQPQAPAREATMAPSRVFSAPKEAKTAAASSFEQKYGDLIPLVTPRPAPEPAGNLQRQIAYENAGVPDTRTAVRPAAPAPRQPSVAELQAIRAVPATPPKPAPLPQPGTTRTAGLDLGTMPSLSELGNFANPPLGTALAFKTSTDRLLPNQIMDPVSSMRVAGVSPGAIAPIPRPPFPRTAVASMLDVTPPRVPVTRASLPMPSAPRQSAGPSLPTLMQAGGYVYAPAAGGGWTNMGRLVSGGGNSDGGSGGGGMSPVRGENRYDPDTNSWSRK